MSFLFTSDYRSWNHYDTSVSLEQNWSIIVTLTSSPLIFLLWDLLFLYSESFVVLCFGYTATPKSVPTTPTVTTLSPSFSPTTFSLPEGTTNQWSKPYSDCWEQSVRWGPLRNVRNLTTKELIYMIFTTVEVSHQYLPTFLLFLYSLRDLISWFVVTTLSCLKKGELLVHRNPFNKSQRSGVKGEHTLLLLLLSRMK